jgi:hypothetical protein
MGDFDRSVDCHMEHLKLATSLGNRIEEARAYSNLGSAHHYKRNFEQATLFHEAVLRIALELKDRSIEARAYAGLGHATRCTGDVGQAKMWHEKQLEIALLTKVKYYSIYMIQLLCGFVKTFLKIFLVSIKMFLMLLFNEQLLQSNLPVSTKIYSV